MMDSWEDGGARAVEVGSIARTWTRDRLGLGNRERDRNCGIGGHTD